MKTWKTWGLLLFLLSALAQGERNRNPIFVLHFEWLEKKYALHVVVPPHLRLPKNDYNLMYFMLNPTRARIPSPWDEEELFALLRDWLPKRCRDYGLFTKTKKGKLETLFEKTNPIDTGRSGIIFVTPEEDWTDILSMLRFDTETNEHPLLGLDHFLMEIGYMKAPFERPEPDYMGISFEKYQFRLMQPSDEGWQFGWFDNGHFLRPTGVFAEVQNLNLLSSEVDFLPLMYLVAEAFDLSQWGGKTIGPGRQELMGVTDYVAHCEGEARLRYFEVMGWNKIGHYRNPDKPHVTNYILHMTREQFKRTLEMAMRDRSGWPVAHRLRFHFDEHHYRSPICAKYLRGPVNTTRKRKKQIYLPDTF